MQQQALAIFPTPDIELICGDCLEVMRGMDSDSVDSIITDPPYALEFMGKGWDKVLPSVDVWKACLRVAKPGAILMAFGGTRTYHRLTCSIEDAGWEIRDCIMWVYGSGFPKSLNIGKAIDKLQGNEREEYLAPIVKPDSDCWGIPNNNSDGSYKETSYNTNAQKVNILGGMRRHTKGTSEYEGYGTSLKPAYEPIVLAMKPLDGTFAENALKWGVSGLWIDGCRVEMEKTDKKGEGGRIGNRTTGTSIFMGKNAGSNQDDSIGRWPANFIHDGSDEVVSMFPQGVVGGNRDKRGGCKYFMGKDSRNKPAPGPGDSGSAARFFYAAKASRAERGEGNRHPTVKPLKLIEYLCKLTMPPDAGMVLDPFMGSGTTGIACKQLGRGFIGIEKEPEYFEIASKRIDIRG